MSDSPSTFPLPPSLRRLVRFSQATAPSHSVTQVSMSFGESMDHEALRRTWEQLLGRHETFRLSIQGGNPSVAPSAELIWSELDWSKEAPDAAASAWQNLLREDRDTPFSLEKAPLCRLTLIRLPGGASHMLWSYHAIMLNHSAAWGVLHEMLLLYEIACSPSPTIPEPSMALKEAWGAVAGPDKEPQGAAKSDKGEFIAALPMHLPGIGGGEAVLVIEKPETDALRTFCKVQDVQLEALFSGAAALALARLGSHEGVRFAWDWPAHHENLPAGQFNQRINLPVTVDEGARVGEWLRMLPSRLSLQSHDESGDAEIAVVLENVESDYAEELRTLLPRWMRIDVRFFEAPCAPIKIICQPGERIRLEVLHNADDVGAAFAARFLRCFARGLHALAEDAARLLCQVEVLDAHEADQIDRLASGPERRAWTQATLDELFKQAVGAQPHSAAIEYDGQSLDYIGLDLCADRLASELATRGVSPGDKVAISMERSSWFIVALLGAWRAGTAVAPLPRSQNLGEIEAMARQCGCKVAICDSTRLRFFENSELPAFALDSEWPRIADQQTPFAAPQRKSRESAVVFTADTESTVLTHAQMANCALAIAARAGIRNGSRVRSHAFESGAFEIEMVVAALLSGATILPVSESSVAPSDHAAPGIIAIEDGMPGEETRDALVIQRASGLPDCGEAAASRLIRLWSPHRCLPSFLQTEDLGEDVTESFRTFPLGKPIANVTVSVVDQAGRRLPIGIAGSQRFEGKGVPSSQVWKALLGNSEGAICLAAMDRLIGLPTALEEEKGLVLLLPVSKPQKSAPKAEAVTIEKEEPVAEPSAQHESSPQAPARTSHKGSFLIPLREEGSECPVYILAEHVDDSAAFDHLVSFILPRHPIFWIQPKILLERREADSLASLATVIAGRLVPEQPFCALSLGETAALTWEVAVRRVERQNPVGSLLLVEARAPKVANLWENFQRKLSGKKETGEIPSLAQLSETYRAKKCPLGIDLLCLKRDADQRWRELTEFVQTHSVRAASADPLADAATAGQVASMLNASVGQHVHDLFGT